MYTHILPVLRCPCCGAGFELAESRKDDEEIAESRKCGEEIIEGKVLCGNGHTFCIHEGILDFQSQEQELFNSWNGYSEEDGNDNLDYELDAHKTVNQKKIEKDFLDSIIEEVRKLKSGFLLDIASGRGVLLREILKNIDADVTVISTDLSLQILTQDRLKLKRLNPHVKVNYIACDATNLPIRDCSMDMACTYVGFTNMANLMESGIRDTARVLKANAPLINSTVYMDENAEGAKRTARFFAENHMEGAEKIYLRNELLTIHKKYFSTVRERIIYEGIAEAVEDDLIPCGGEWFANALLIAE